MSVIQSASRYTNSDVIDSSLCSSINAAKTMSDKEDWENRAVHWEQQTVVDMLRQVEASANEPYWLLSQQVGF